LYTFYIYHASNRVPHPPKIEVHVKKRLEGTKNGPHHIKIMRSMTIKTNNHDIGTGFELLKMVFDKN
jgi:hypothetical protein